MSVGKQNYFLSDEQKALCKEFRVFFVNTGGNDVIELIERRGVNFFNNAPLAALQVACHSQLQMLMLLKKAGLLKSNDHT